HDLKLECRPTRSVRKPRAASGYTENSIGDAPSVIASSMSISNSLPTGSRGTPAGSRRASSRSSPNGRRPSPVTTTTPALSGGHRLRDRLEMGSRFAVWKHEQRDGQRHALGGGR